MAPFGVMQDFLRIQLVRSGVDTIVSAHGQGAFLYAFVFAVCKSSGFLFLKYAEQVSDRGLQLKHFLLFLCTALCTHIIQ